MVQLLLIIILSSLFNITERPASVICQDNLDTDLSLDRLLKNDDEMTFKLHIQKYKEVQDKNSTE